MDKTFEIEELRAAIKAITPWLSASLSDDPITGKKNNSCKEYIDACNLVFEVDHKYNN